MRLLLLVQRELLQIDVLLDAVEGAKRLRMVFFSNGTETRSKASASAVSWRGL